MLIVLRAVLSKNQRYQSKSDVIISLMLLSLIMTLELKMRANENYLKLKEKILIIQRRIVSHLRFLEKNLVDIHGAATIARNQKKNRVV